MVAKLHSIVAVLSIAPLVCLCGCSVQNPFADTSQTSSEANSAVDATDRKGKEKPAATSSAKPEPSPMQKTVRETFAVPPGNPDPTVQKQIQQYINRLASQGFSQQAQGVWMQSENQLLANHQGTVPLPAASLTKVATTLAALETFGPDRQFVTLFGTNGTVKNGDLQGDLIVRGGKDPFFVWEEAIAVGNLLNEMGIQRVTGDLIIVGDFYMNFKTDSQTSGRLLQIGLDSRRWSPEAQKQYQTLPANTPKPQVAIAGSTHIENSLPNNFQPLIHHDSFPLAELLKKMNRYSNNKMAEMLAEAVGGAEMVSKKAAAAAKVPPEEIHLMNGSGLGVDNRISPRAVVAMFLAIEKSLQSYNMGVADIFAIVGKDKGILDPRPLPAFSILKSGSLDEVSALAGVLPTQQGNIWFAITNFGGNLTRFRRQQEQLLQDLLAKRGKVSSLPSQLLPNPERNNKSSSNQVVGSPSQPKNSQQSQSVDFRYLPVVNRQANAATTQTDDAMSAADKKRFREVWQDAREQNLQALSMGEITQAIAKQFLGTPYVDNLLSRGDGEELVVSLTKFDCFLFVETILALAKGVVLQDSDMSAFHDRIVRQRYRQGEVNGYCSRIHYFSEWIRHNQQQNMVKDITADLGGVVLEKQLDFMSSHRYLYPRMANSDRNYQCIQDMESNLEDMTVRYLPTHRIKNIYNSLQAGDIIGIATQIPGLDVSHTGFVYRNSNGEVGLIHASPNRGVTISPDLATYVANVPYAKGILVARPVDPRS